MTTEIWADEDRRLPRVHLLVPCLLMDTETSVQLKAVILDLNGAGCRVFTNDKRVRAMPQERILGKKLRLEFDLFEVDTEGIEGEVVNVHPGQDADNERQLGIHFTRIDKTAVRDINRVVLRERAAGRE